MDFNNLGSAVICGAFIFGWFAVLTLVYWNVRRVNNIERKTLDDMQANQSIEFKRCFSNYMQFNRFVTQIKFSCYGDTGMYSFTNPFAPLSTGTPVNLEFNEDSPDSDVEPTQSDIINIEDNV